MHLRKGWLVLSVFVAAPALAGAQAVLELPAVAGDAAARGGKSRVEVLSWSWGATNSSAGATGAGKVSVQDHRVRVGEEPLVEFLEIGRVAAGHGVVASSASRSLIAPGFPCWAVSSDVRAAPVKDREVYRNGSGFAARAGADAGSGSPYFVGGWPAGARPRPCTQSMKWPVASDR